MSQLTFLIRTHKRPTQYTRCLLSVPKDCHTITHVQAATDLAYVSIGLHHCSTIVDTDQPYFYNLYCNTLLAQLRQGHGIFLDDDDTVIPGNVEHLRLEDGKSYLVPFMRGRYEVPHLWGRKGYVERGFIGMPCLILWHEHKHLVHFEAVEDADYRAIRALQDKITLEWIHLPVVYSSKRSFGQVEPAY